MARLDTPDLVCGQVIDRSVLLSISMGLWLGGLSALILAHWPC